MRSNLQKKKKRNQGKYAMHNKVENNKIARNKPKEVEDFKILRRVQKKDFPSSWTRRIDIVKMAIQRSPSTFQ